MNTCPHCGETHRQVKSGKTKANSQRYKCQVCGHRYTPNPKPAGYDDEIRKIAIRLYADGINFRRIARHLQVHHQTIINWVNAYVAQLPSDPPMPAHPDAIEADELFSFIQHKKTSSTS
jgi:transposase-like protein